MMSGSGGVDASIPLRAGTLNEGPGASQPSLIDRLTGVERLLAARNQNALFPGQKELQGLELARGRTSIYANGLAPLSGRDNLSVRDVIGAAASLELNGVNTGALLQDFHSRAGTDPASLQQWVRDWTSRGLPAGGQIALYNQQPVEIDTGAEKIIGTRPGLFSGRNPAEFTPVGGAPIGPSVPMTLSPAGQTDLVTVPVMKVNPATGLLEPTNATEMITRAEAAKRAGLDHVLPQGAFGGTGGRIVPPPSTVPAGVGGPPPAAGTPASSTPPVARPPTSQTGASTSFGTTVAPVDQAAMVATATKAADMVGLLHAAADQVPRQREILSNMQAELHNTTTGIGQSKVFDAKRFVQSFAPEIAKRFGITEASIANGENFNKLAINLINEQASQLGFNTDESRQRIGAGSPNMEISKLGLMNMIGRLQGNQDAIEAKRQAWNTAQSQYGVANFPRFSAEWNEKNDPRYFQMMRLFRDGSPDGARLRQQFMSEMPDAAALIRGFTQWKAVNQR